MTVEKVDILNDLVAGLPPGDQAADGEDLDRLARGVLGILIARMRNVDASRIDPLQIDPATCPNCGVPVASKTTPYCSDCCRERAAFARQMRDGLASGSLLDEHRQTMKGEALWRLLGGGLPRRLALVPEKDRQRVFRRADYKCEICNAPATTIDNTGSG